MKDLKWKYRNHLAFEARCKTWRNEMAERNREDAAEREKVIARMEMTVTKNELRDYRRKLQTLDKRIRQGEHIVAALDDLAAAYNRMHRACNK